MPICQITAPGNTNVAVGTGIPGGFLSPGTAAVEEHHVGTKPRDIAQIQDKAGSQACLRPGPVPLPQRREAGITPVDEIGRAQ